MYRSALSPLLVALALFTPFSLPGQETSSACRLLEVGELEAAIGGKASTKPAGLVQTVPGMTLDQCTVELSGSGTIHTVAIQIVSKLGMDGAQAITIRNTASASEPQWKVAGARLEQAKVGNAICILTGRPSVASHSTCSVPRGEGYVELDVTGPVDALPSLTVVGALVQKAGSRL